MPPRDTTTTLDPIEDITRRRVITAVPILTLMAAGLSCGEDDDSAAGGNDARLTVRNRFGTYEVPANPQRLVVMDNRDALETAVALGMAPAIVGQRFAFEGGRVDYAAPWVPLEERETDVFDGREPDLELLLRLEPDLILADSTRFDGGPTFEQLSTIAPVVPLDRSKPWRAGLEEIAAWLQRERQLSEVTAEYDTLVDSLRSKHSGALTSARVAYGAYESQTIWLADLDAHELPASEALGDLGGRPFDTGLAADPSLPGWRAISMETLNVVADADALFFWAPDAEQRDELLAHPVWELLPAVQDNRAYISTNNVGSGSIYTVMEALRLWDGVYSSFM